MAVSDQEPPSAGAARAPQTRRTVPRPPPPSTAARTGTRAADETAATATTSPPRTATPATPASPPPAPAPPPAAQPPTLQRGLRRFLERIAPRTALGISTAVLAFALGAALSGVVLYSYYEYRLTQTQDKVAGLSGGITSAAKKAQSDLQAEEAAAQALINQQIQPLKSILATGQTLQAIVAKMAPSLYFVHTLDANGQPSVGTAFSVASDTHQTLLLTSYTVVQAATRKPGPPLFIRHGSGADQQVTVYTWDETNDLALIILQTGNQPKLTFASTSPKPGERVYAISGLGAQGGSITQGFVADVSAQGIQHDARVGTQFQGGPLLNTDGQVIGILSRTFSPLGFPVADVYFAVLPGGACAKVLQCPNGTPSGTGSSGGH